MSNKICGICNKSFNGYGNSSLQPNVKGKICDSCNKTNELNYRLQLLNKFNEDKGERE